MRSTFRDWAEERTSHPSIVYELSLAHTVGDAVQNAYRRTDLLEKRERLMQQFADFCNGPVTARNVTPMRRRARS
jgi:hypothetical protein